MPPPSHSDESYYARSATNFSEGLANSGCLTWRSVNQRLTGIQTLDGLLGLNFDGSKTIKIFLTEH